MSRGRDVCTALGDPTSWSTEAPLPVPDWIRDDRSWEWGVERGQMSGGFRVRLSRPDAKVTSASGPRTPTREQRRRVLIRAGFPWRFRGG